jgi:L-arabinokinase
VPAPSIVFYTSSHGLGHISRDIEVIHAVAARFPDARFTIRTSAPAWFVHTSLRVPVEIAAVEVDSGVVQRDSLTVDVPGTAREAAGFYAEFDTRVAEEARFLSSIEASVVVGDVPPLAFAAARHARIPGVLLANFTWDWIYDAYPDFEHRAPGVLQTIRSAYAAADVVLRLPLSGGFASVSKPIRDIPLIARRSALGREAARARLNLTASEIVVLVSFGRYGLGLPLDRVARESGLRVMVSADGDDATVPGDVIPTFLRLSGDDLKARELRYEDLVAAADVVVTKPGYGIVAECAVNRTALLYADRGRFVEQDLLVREMPRLVRCRPISQERLMGGDWRADAESLLAQPMPVGEVSANGAEVAAQAIWSACWSG